MRISRQNFTSTFKIARRGLALVSIAAVLASTMAIDVGAQKKRTSVSRLSDEQRILHVLNRLGFGARPGDVERVKAMGVERYIEQQLNPGKVSDALAETKVKDLSTLSMSTAQLYEKYPQPGQLIRQLQRRGDLPDDLAAARQNKGKSSESQTPAQSGSNESMTPEVMPKKGNEPGSSPDAAARNNEEYRRIIRDYYLQNGLQPPQRITAELQASRILRAVYSERQLQEVLVDFWTNHFNVFAGKGADRWLLTSYDRDTIRPNTLGKFHDLLLATAQSPAMLFYLDNFQSVSPNARATRNGPNPRRAQGDSIFGRLMGRRAGRMDRFPEVRPVQQGANMPQAPAQPPRQRRGINENYARELMELHTLGVDGGYTQKDVQEVARCFTGWTIFAPRGGGAAVAALMGAEARENAGKFYFNARMHDEGEKIVLGQKIPAGGGMKDGLLVLDILARHPSTANFIATKLTRYFVQDNPSSALVDRVAAQFTKSGGDIRETLKAIFASAEFNSPEAYRAKIKRPFELASSAMRTLGAETNGGPQLHQWIARMGEPLYLYQTPNGYSDTAESWVNTGGLLERLNFGLSLASNRIPGTRVDLKRLAGDAASREGVDKASIMERFLNLIVAGEFSLRTRETLLKQWDQETGQPNPSVADEPASRVVNPVVNNGNDVQRRQRQQQLARADANVADPVTRIVGLILGSPEFQRQ
ncbi:MAG: DUF1800 domain-containing protein [Pyrinomonadaceae bacterium]|nr:DUF1800 domain-containing protein [Pyrinomonadaceae bacterium]